MSGEHVVQGLFQPWKVRVGMSSGIPPSLLGPGHLPPRAAISCASSAPAQTSQQACSPTLLPPCPPAVSLASALWLSTWGGKNWKNWGGGGEGRIPQRLKPALKGAEQQGQPEPLACVQLPC